MPLIKSRDVRTNVAEHGFERGIVVSLEALIDEFVGTRQQMRELTQLVAQCIDQVEKMVHVGDSMRLKIDELKRIHQQGNSDGSSEG